MTTKTQKKAMAIARNIIGTMRIASRMRQGMIEKGPSEHAAMSTAMMTMNSFFIISQIIITMSRTKLTTMR